MPDWKGAERSVGGAAALREKDDMHAMVKRGARVREAAAEACALRQWEDVEERGDQPVSKRRQQAKPCVPLHLRVAPARQQSAGHGDRRVPPDMRRQPQEHDRKIECRHVIADDEHRLLRDKRFEDVPHGEKAGAW